MTAWTLLAIGTALTQQPVVWLAIGATVGFIYFRIIRRMAKRYLGDDFSGTDREDSYFSLAFIFAIATFGIYISTAFAFTNSGFVGNLIAALLILFVITTFWLTFAGLNRRDSRDENILLIRQKRIVAALEVSRWIGHPDGSGSGSGSGSGLLDPLTAIPAARFAGIPEGIFPLVAVSGTRVLLVTFVNWPPGVYASDPGATADIWHNGKYSQKVTAELKDIISKSEQWNKALPAATLQVAIVARPSTSARAGKITFKINEVHSDRRKLEVAFTTLETFEDTAGQFLAAEPYFLSASALEQLKTHLDTLESETASPR